MKVLVTGASGFLGGYLVEELLGGGHSVRALVRASSDRSQLAGAELAHGSLEDAGALDAALVGVDAVVHAAGLTKARSAADFERVNVEGTRTLVERAARRGGRRIRFVYVSSIAAGGPGEGPFPRAAEAGDGPVTTYGRSKLAGERVVLAAPGIESCAVRPPTIYGPRDRESLPLFRLARLGLRVVFRGGVEAVSMIHARDCAAAVRHLVEAERLPGRVYPVDDGSVHAIAELTRQIARAVGRRALALPVPIGALRAVAAAGELFTRLGGRPLLLDRDKVAEFSARFWISGHESITRDTGWKPSIPLEVGLEQTARWYRDRGWL